MNFYRGLSHALLFSLTFFLCLLPPKDAFAESSVTKQVEVSLRSGDVGYEWATYDVRYRFLTCQGRLSLWIEFMHGSWEFSDRYLMDGRVEAAPPPSQVFQQGTFSGNVQWTGSGGVLRSFTYLAGTQASGGCWGDLIDIGSASQYIREGALPGEVVQILNGLEIGNVALRDRYRNTSFESSVRQREREAALAAEREVRELEAKKQAEERARAEAETAQQQTEAGGGVAAGAGVAGVTASSDDSDDSDDSDEPSDTDTSTETYAAPEAYQYSADSDANAQVDQYQQYFADMQALGAQRQAEREREEARQAEQRAREHAEYVERRTEECKEVSDIDLESDPVFFVPRGFLMTDDSKECRNGEYVGEGSTAVDVFSFQLTAPTELRFLLAGNTIDQNIELRQGPLTVAEAIQEVMPEAMPETVLGSGTDFTRQLPPGSYKVEISAGRSRWDDLYYFRLFSASTCWLEDAKDISSGSHEVSVEKATCTGGGGLPGAMFRLPPVKKERRDIELKLMGTDIRLLVLAGKETRRLKLDYQSGVGQIGTHIKNARPEDIYVLVSSASSAPVRLEVDARVIPFKASFLPAFQIGGLGSTIRGSDIAGTYNLGFSMGAQIRPKVGVSAVVFGGIGGGVFDDAGGTFGWVFGGPGVHLGSPRDFVRLTPGFQMALWNTGDGDQVFFGPALRLDGMISIGQAGFAHVPYAQIASIDGKPMFGFGIGWALGKTGPPPEPDDE